MRVVSEGAIIIGESQGAYLKVLTYKRRCGACGYLATEPSYAVSTSPHDASYAAQGFSCPRCAHHQAVRIRGGSEDGKGSLASIGGIPA